MNESPQASTVGVSRGRNLPRVTMAASLLVLTLAMGAVFFPRSGGFEMQGRLLVLDSPGNDVVRMDLFQSLAHVLGEMSGHSMDLVVTDTRESFFRRAKEGADFVLCPDGLALELSQENYGPLVAGRRKLPANLRPRGVVVFRKSLGQVDFPWESHPTRTVFGDSLSLVATGGLGEAFDSDQCSFGPDPYDHRPVLHALRLGAFDFALVRQWDAAGFFSSGLLDDEIWGMENRTMPVPDVVMMASTEIPLAVRLKWADYLALTGRAGETGEKNPELLAGRMQKLGLAGFNILLEPDFDLVRRNFSRHWPVAVD